MGSHISDQITAILTAIIGVAILAVILSRNSNTSGVIASAAEGFSIALGTAVSPITGNTKLGPSGGFTGFGGFGVNTGPGNFSF